MKALIVAESSQYAKDIAGFLQGKMAYDIFSYNGKPEDFANAGAETVYHLNEMEDPFSIAESVQSILPNHQYNAIFFPMTVLGSESASILSEKINSDMVSGILSYETLPDGKIKTSRYLYGGKAVLTEISSAKIFTVVSGVSDPFSSNAQSKIEEIPQKSAPKITIGNKIFKEKGSVEIDKAEVLVSVGRGIGKKDGMAMVQQLASLIHAELAGSRPICMDYHWLSEDRQVGITGKKVKPKLYIALGISGQIQHIVGMRSSKVVISVNKDKNAPIFSESDYGVVDDLYHFVPLLINALK
ncbi:MAG: electron transfer flavoprotein subunit alpha/FixB family protein [Thermoplasmata archaeon]